MTIMDKTSTINSYKHIANEITELLNESKENPDIIFSGKIVSKFDELMGYDMDIIFPCLYNSFLKTDYYFEAFKNLCDVTDNIEYIIRSNSKFEGEARKYIAKRIANDALSILPIMNDIISQSINDICLPQSELNGGIGLSQSEIEDGNVRMELKIKQLLQTAMKHDIYATEQKIESRREEMAAKVFSKPKYVASTATTHQKRR